MPFQLTEENIIFIVDRLPVDAQLIQYPHHFYRCLKHIDKLIEILSENPNIIAGEKIPEESENVEVLIK